MVLLGLVGSLPAEALLRPCLWDCCVGWGPNYSLVLVGGPNFDWGGLHDVDALSYTCSNFGVIAPIVL